jgi:hypothetical protein
MTKIDIPIWMTVEKANKIFKPDSYVMYDCEIYNGSVIAGFVIARAPVTQKNDLVDFAWALSEKNTHGKISIEDTKDLLNGEAMWVELHTVEAE